jgi:hypothetical protein
MPDDLVRVGPARDRFSEHLKTGSAIEASIMYEKVWKMKFEFENVE